MLRIGNGFIVVFAVKRECNMYVHGVVGIDERNIIVFYFYEYDMSMMRYIIRTKMEVVTCQVICWILCFTLFTCLLRLTEQLPLVINERVMHEECRIVGGYRDLIVVVCLL
jgi:hypothetical protein